MDFLMRDIKFNSIKIFIFVISKNCLTDHVEAWIMCGFCTAWSKVYLVFINFVVLRSPIEVILENGKSLYLEEALFSQQLSHDMDLPVRIKYTAGLGGHVMSISVVRDIVIALWFFFI